MTAAEPVASPAASTATASAAAHKTAILAIILVSYVMIVLDISVVLTGLPSIHRELGFSDSGLAWVQSAYTLTFGGFLLLAARAGDIVGRRRLLVFGLVLFTVTSLVIGLATTPAAMVGARALQGLGAAILAPSTLTLLQSTFAEGSERTRAISYYSAAAGIAASVGLVLGGVLTQWTSWRVGFFINLPIGIAMVWATLRYVAESPRRSGQFDVIGALTSTAGMSALVYGMIRSASSGWADTVTQSAVLAGLLLLVAFVVNERRAAQPIMPLRLFALPQRAAAYGARVLFLGAMVGFFFFITQYLQVILNYSPAMSGLAFLPVTTVNFAVALQVPRLTQRFGNGTVLTAGLSLALAGMAWLSQISVGSDYLLAVALPMVLIGAGQGLALSPLTAAGLVGVAPRDAGAASGVVSVAHQLGNSLGLAVLVAVAAYGADAATGKVLLLHRIVTALHCAAGLLALALLVVACFIRPADSAPHPETA